MKLQRFIERIHFRSKGHQIFRIISLVILFSLARPTGSAAVTYFNQKLSGTMVDTGDVVHFGGGGYEVSPDGQYVVFLADRDTDGRVEVFSVSVAGGETQPAC